MENLKMHHNKLVIDRTIKALEKNNMKGYYAVDKKAYFDLLSTLIDDKSIVSLGGSITLFETGTIDWLRKRNIIFLDRYKKGLCEDDIRKIYVQSFDADVYLTSSNAVTETGNLYNVDGRGNRVAAMIYGPKRVVVIIGSNKIVRDDSEAIIRNKRLAAPMNAMRLNRKTPCVSTGYCIDCNAPDRICSAYVFLKKQMQQDRIHVIILNEALGY